MEILSAEFWHALCFLSCMQVGETSGTTQKSIETTIVSGIPAGDRQRLTYLMGDFHIRIAELSGNAIIIDILRDLTARTILISMLYQSEFHAAQSHEGHCRIFAAMHAGDFVRAAELSVEHLDEVEIGLDLTTRPDPLSELRSSLSLPPRTASLPLRSKKSQLQRSN
ncbi:hypothetical protein JOH51_005369 [Rhizobium leguminosarum]|nr:hypothetical protein [Rhizobium leguminosarum]